MTMCELTVHTTKVYIDYMTGFRHTTTHRT